MSDSAILDDAIENHIRGLPWSENASEEVKTIIAGNIRHAFAALHMDEVLEALRDQMDPVTRCVESCPVKEVGQHSMACTAARQVITKLEAIADA